MATPIRTYTFNAGTVPVRDLFPFDRQVFNSVIGQLRSNRDYDAANILTNFVNFMSMPTSNEYKAVEIRNSKANDFLKGFNSFIKDSQNYNSSACEAYCTLATLLLAQHDNMDDSSASMLFVFCKTKGIFKENSILSTQLLPAMGSELLDAFQSTYRSVHRLNHAAYRGDMNPKLLDHMQNKLTIVCVS
jgi:hypothetical protein